MNPRNKVIPLSLSNYHPRRLDFWIGLVMVVAVVLRTVHYFGRSSMWLDELASAFNIKDRSFWQLATETLDFNQVAPLGFLWLQKLSTLLFGVNDHAFRFFPFVFSLISLALFYDLSKRFLTGIARLGALALFGLSMAMVFYGGESKQYSGDIAASLFIVWTAVKMFDGKLSPKQLWMVSAGGFLLIFSSMPAVVIAPAVLLIVLVQLIKKRLELPAKQFVIVAVAWGLATIFLVGYAKLIISPDVQQAMSDYWSRGFAPLTGIGEFLQWIVFRMQKELNFSLAWFAAGIAPQLGYIAWALLILSIPGIVYLSKHSALKTLILLSPLLVALLLSILRILPFDGRVSVYASWPLILTGMAGILALSIWIPRIPKVVIAVPTLLIALPVGLIITLIPMARPPYNGQSAQPVLRAMKKQMQPGDKIYVYFKSRYAMRFYGPKEGITEYIQGRGYPSVEPILRDIDSLKGNKRVWFFFSQWTPGQPYPDSIKHYMGNVIGKEIGVIPDPDGNNGEQVAAAHLYDLSGNESSMGNVKQVSLKE